MKVFLTGGTGFIGQPLTRDLLAKGWSVTSLVRKAESAQARAISKMGAQLSAGDITQRESMRAGMSGADIVIHNAGHYEWGLNAAGRQRMLNINVAGTENVLGMALELGVPRTVYISTVWAFGETGKQARDETFARQTTCRTWYEQTKTDAHLIAQQYQQRGLPLIIVCPHGVIGPNDHSVWGYYQRLYLNRLMPPMAWSPDTVFSLVEVNDLGRGIVLAAEKARLGETYILAGEPRSLREHLAFWQKRPGGFKAALWMPAGLMYAMFWPLEPLQRLLGLPAFMSREGVQAAATNLNYSSAKAQQELGWTHKTAQEMWLGTLDREIELMRLRRKRDLASRLNPLELEE
jgi:dihydroflavonol-4-reductase